MIDALCRYFGDEAKNYIDYCEKNWNKENYSGGCPTCIVSSAEVMRDYVKSTREPFLNVSFRFFYT